MNHADNEQNITKKKLNIVKFAAVEIFTVGLATGWFFLWAYVSYNLRFSAEVIRAGLVLIYIVPCLLGGKVLRRCVQCHAPLWGAGLGAGMYMLLLVLIIIEAKGTIVFSRAYVINLLLCILSGVAGTVCFRKKEAGGNQ